MRQSISQWLALSGFDTETYPSAEDALKSIGPEFPGVVVIGHQDARHGRHGVSETADGAWTAVCR